MSIDQEASGKAASEESIAQVEARIQANQRALSNSLATFREELKTQVTESVARVSNKLEDGVDRISDKVEHSIDRVSGQLEQGVGMVSQKIGGGVDQVRGTIENVSTNVDDALKNLRQTLDLPQRVQEKPFVAVGVAVGVGVLISQLMPQGSRSPRASATIPSLRPAAAPSAPLAGLGGPSLAVMVLTMLRPILVSAAESMVQRIVKEKFNGPTDRGSPNP